MTSVGSIPGRNGGGPGRHGRQGRHERNLQPGAGGCGVWELRSEVWSYTKCLKMSKVCMENYGIMEMYGINSLLCHFMAISWFCSGYFMQRMGYELDSWTQAFLTQKFLSKCPLMHTTLQWFASIQMFCIYQQCVFIECTIGYMFICLSVLHTILFWHLPVWIYVYYIYIYICNDAYIRTHVIIHLYMNTFADNCIHVSSFLWVSTGHLMPNLLRCTHDASCRHLEKFRTQWGLDSLSRGP